MEFDVVHVDINNVARYRDELTRDLALAESLAPVVIVPFYEARFSFSYKRGVDISVVACTRSIEDYPFQLPEDIASDATLFTHLAIFLRGHRWAESSIFTNDWGEWASRESSVTLSDWAIESGADKGMSFDQKIGYLSKGTSFFVIPVLMAISFLHCKNIELINKPISRQQRRLAARKGVPLVQQKVLVIDAFKKQVRNEAKKHDESELKRALHICRGHFRTYSKDKPLFGKLSGTYWVPMHARGDKTQGEVRKGYKVVT